MSAMSVNVVDWVASIYGLGRQVNQSVKGHDNEQAAADCARCSVSLLFVCLSWSKFPGQVVRQKQKSSAKLERDI